PLRLGIQSALRMLEGGQPSPAELEPRLRMSERQMMRLSRLVESLLDLSRLTRGPPRLETAPCDLATLVRDVLERSHDVLTHAGCTLDAKVEGPLPVLCDPLRMEQVLENMLSNAMKYGAGGPVRVHCRAERGRALLSVEDEGIGIPLEDQQRIFERFERAAPMRHYGGFGLGLHILKEIIEAHGGDVSVESQPGQGARFTVTLPLLDTPA
ncbi:MAG TPA: HAMP domain-containing sensor histidine kinase, partial [Cystobacter sp.]